MATTPVHTAACDCVAGTVSTATTISDAAQNALIYRNARPHDPPVQQLAGHIDVLIAEIRKLQQANTGTANRLANLRNDIRIALRYSSNTGDTDD